MASFGRDPDYHRLGLRKCTFEHGGEPNARIGNALPILEHINVKLRVLRSAAVLAQALVEEPRPCSIHGEANVEISLQQDMDFNGPVECSFTSYSRYLPPCLVSRPSSIITVP
jgi:hypothetical protein